MDELNELPQGWKWVRLGDLYEITSSKRVFESEWKKNGIPFYRAREIVKLAQQGFVDNELFISDDMYNQFSEKYGIPKEGDIMITGVGTLGICYVVKSDDKFYFKDGNVIWLKRKNDINSQFIELAFKTDFLRKQIDDSVGATVGTYTIIKAKNTLIPFPPPLEQQRLATLLTAKLSLIEQAKEKITAQLQAAQELTAAYLREVFESEEAKGWELKTLGEICQDNGFYGTSAKSFYEDNGVKIINMNNIFEGKVIWKNTKYVFLNENETKKYLLKKGDLVFNRTNSAELVGKSAVFQDDIETVFASYLIRFRLIENIANPFLVCWYINSHYGRKFIEDNMTRAVGQVNISASTMVKMSIPLPPINKQKQLANYLSEKLATVEQLKATLQTQLDSINQLPAALLKQTFSGNL